MELHMEFTRKSQKIITEGLDEMSELEYDYAIVSVQGRNGVRGWLL